MKRLAPLALLLTLAGCIPIVVGAAAGRSAARSELRESGPVDDSGVRMVGIAIGENLIVSAVEPGGPAAEAGVQVGDLVLQVDGYAIEHVQQARNYLAGRADRKVYLDVFRDGEHLTFRLKRRCLPELGCAQSAPPRRSPTTPVGDPRP